MATTTYQFFPYNGSYSYDKWDVIQGAGVASNDARFFYSTIPANFGNDPLARFYYTVTQTTRMSTEVMRVSFTQTGTNYFTQGSIVVIANVSPDASANFTGTALAGGDGYVDFLSAGLTSTNGVFGGTVTAPINPAWTTGFYWLPGYQTKITNKQIVLKSDLGEGYSQRMNPVINSNSMSWSLVYTERTDKEIRALANFLQDKGGAVPFVINFPVGKLSNRNDIQYIGGELEEGLDSFGLNSASVTVTQVFDL